MPNFVEVVLPLAVKKTFTYRITEEQDVLLQPGMRVAVPFGKKKIFTGLVIDKHQQPPLLYEAKEIHEVLDEYPVVTPQQIQLWTWISEYYMCSLGEVFKAAMPSAFLLESETKIIFNPDFKGTPQELTDEEYLIFEALQHQTQLSLLDIQAILDKKTIIPLIQKLIQRGLIQLQEEIHEIYKPKLVRFIRLAESFHSEDALSQLLNELSRAQKQSAVLLAYFQLQASEKKPISVKKLTEFSGVSTSIVKALIDKEIFEEYFLVEDRTDVESSGTSKIPQLSEAQQNAFDSIKNQWQQYDTCLLHGVTASGKTEIYIRLIREMLETGKQVLFLLPEIALTTQLVSRLRSFFGNSIAVYHSRYNRNERVEVWQQVLEHSPKAQLIVGARSSIFLPFHNLGLIIVDEEHEVNFKQTDPAPRYHARDTAMVLAHLHQAKVLLGSATPALETYYNCNSKKYGLVELLERFGEAPLPETILVDLKDKYKRKKMTGHLSDVLIEHINDALSQGEQVILFQNRRGFAPLMECLTCGHIPQCPNCDVSLTYHKFKNQLRCHYCGHSVHKPSHCHACHSPDLTTKGFGTEQIELELATLFPKNKIARMDQDTTGGKHGYESLIYQFQNREIDILVGTQMLAKGLDFAHVSLVAILNADNMLFFPDFRALERSYQMMVQVSGRAGRADKTGKVIIQTYNPSHAIIQQIVSNNYSGMYQDQMVERRQFQYPPFYRVIKLTLKHKNFELTKESALWLYQVLKNNFTIPVLGPEEPAISKIRNEYIRTILIKIPMDSPLTKTKKTIQRVLDSFEAVPQYRAVRVIVNVDVY